MSRMRLPCAVLMALSGCGGAGTVAVTTWGEDYIEDRIPASEFEDGFSVEYSRFLVVLKEVALARQTGETGPRQTQARVVDVTKPGPTTLFTWDQVPAGKWDVASFAIGPASDAVAGGEVAAADLERMTSQGLSLILEGTVSGGGVSKRLAWAFSGDTAYGDCVGGDAQPGVTVPLGGTAELQLTLHGDHPWYDALGGEAKLRGQAVVDADANADGEVTLEELEAVPLTRFPLGQYDSGSASNVRTLRDFVTRLTRTVGHFRGEGECTVTAR